MEIVAQPGGQAESKKFHGLDRVARHARETRIVNPQDMRHRRRSGVRASPQPVRRTVRGVATHASQAVFFRRFLSASTARRPAHTKEPTPQTTKTYRRSPPQHETREQKSSGKG